MNYLLILSFDLYNAKPEDYECLKKELENLRLSDILVDDDGIERHLPTTTYAGKFNNSDSLSLSKDIFNKVKRAFKKCKVKGKIFVAIGENWAWRIQELIQKD